ncbi:MAG TPA: CoA ester lyase [Micromonospora sp.]
MNYSREFRSVLSAPAHKARYHRTGLSCGATMYVVDLEDSVPEEHKDEARVALGRILAAPATGGTLRGVRINPITTAAGLADLLALRGYDAEPDAVFLPKVESSRDVQIAEQVLGDECAGSAFVAMVETPVGLENSAAIAGASPRVRALVFGAADYCSVTGIRLSWETLAPARAHLINSAGAAQVRAIDAPTFDLADSAALKREARWARDLGFSGKWALHPEQVPVINEEFTPSRDVLETARRIVAQGEAAGSGISVVDGQMVGPPFYRAFQRIIQESAPAGTSTASDRGAELPVQPESIDGGNTRPGNGTAR